MHECSLSVSVVITLMLDGEQNTHRYLCICYYHIQHLHLCCIIQQMSEECSLFLRKLKFAARITHSLTFISKVKSSSPLESGSLISGSILQPAPQSTHDSFHITNFIHANQCRVKAEFDIAQHTTPSISPLSFRKAGMAGKVSYAISNSANLSRLHILVLLACI